MKSKKDSIVFVNQSSGYLMIDIIHEHLPFYSNVVLLTGFLNPRNRDLDSSVRVHFLKTYKNNTVLKRLLSWMIFSFQTFILIFFTYRKSDIYWVTNPPFTAFLCSLFRKRNYACLIYDVYPEVLVQSGLLSEGNLLTSIWRKVNQKNWKYASKVFTISHSMKDLIKHKGQKVEVVPIWTDNFFLKPIPKDQNQFLKSLGLEKKFIVLYSGNLGITHPLESLIEAANIITDHNVHFLIIGEGGKKKSLENMSRMYNLQNVSFLPWQSTETLPQTLASADIGVVTLDENVADVSVPSKTFNLMSVGVALLAIGSELSELGTIIRNYKNGRIYSSIDISGMVSFILELYNNKENLKKYSEASAVASLDFTSKNATKMVLRCTESS